MVMYFLAIASLVLISPLILFLPLGLTKKGKLIIIIISFLIAVFGLISINIFDWWQVILFMFVLIALSSFLLDNRMSYVLYAESSGEVIDIESLGDHSDDKLQKETSWEGSQILLKKDEFYLETDTKMSDPHPDSVLTNEGKNPFDIELKVEIEDFENIIDNSFDKPLEISDAYEEDTYEDEEFNLFEDPEVERDSVDELESHNDLTYLSELEKLILSSDENLEKEIAHAVHLDKKIEHELEDIINIESSEDDDEYIDIIAEFDSLKAEAAPTIEQDIGLDDFERKSLDSLTQDLNNKIFESSLPYDSDSSSEMKETVDITSKEIDFSVESRETNIADEQLQKQVFKTLLAQVKLAKATSEPAQYEKLIQECLHPKMSKLEYYTFASFLIQHYISFKAYEKLQDLLNDLESKYKDFPVISQEIQFMKTNFPSDFIQK